MNITFLSRSVLFPTLLTCILLSCDKKQTDDFVAIDLNESPAIACNSQTVNWAEDVPDFKNYWRGREYAYLITVSEEYTYRDPYSYPWDAAIIIDNELYESEKLNLSFGFLGEGVELHNDKFSILSADTPLRTLQFNKIGYQLEGDYTFIRNEGVLNFEGYGIDENGNQIPIQIVSKAQKVTQSPETSCLVEGYGAEVLGLNFLNKQEVVADILIGDLVYPANGTWNYENDHLSFDLSFENGSELDYSYTVGMLSDSRMKLLERIEKFQSTINIPAEKLESAYKTFEIYVSEPIN